jgi:hypothetical protein
MEKKGQGLSTNAIILIVLGVVVLVILIAGFTIGWSNIAPWLSSENVGTIVSSCETACSTNNQYAYCSTVRKLVDSEKKKVETTCDLLERVNDYDKYAVAECSSISSCDLKCGEIKITEEGNLRTGTPQANCVAPLQEVSATDIDTGMKCCI